MRTRIRLWGLSERNVVCAEDVGENNIRLNCCLTGVTKLNRKESASMSSFFFSRNRRMGQSGRRGERWSCSSNSMAEWTVQVLATRK